MPDLERVAQSLARNLKRLRQEHGYSLDALAARSGVSRGMIIQIEQARTNPSVGTVIRLADALGVSIAGLIDYADGPTVRMVTPEQAVKLWETPAGSHGTLLVGTEAPGPLELWSWRLMPGEGHDSDPHPVGTAELIRVDAGELTLVVDGEEFRVPAGSAAGFEAGVPHGYHNTGSVPVEMTLAISVPPPR
ncbi:helix-turn-helix domain-containing protein [Streptantibioticus ferralitis]|uniref:Helix-turn-helix domain-containing protein n=1 Tax=Streptantibioticus ferralitis TaxID=236510 RepID=A0ABT5ZB15_9ACTN|nr:helix-turn-helix domain-containing protein [Streptantibioticus ferralitis]MDF2260868.1 helix-turn-helix domain-containing protein [Streptantibioticus ferralitis]